MIKYDKKDHTLEVDTPNAKLKLDQNDLLSLRQALFDLPVHNSSELVPGYRDAILWGGIPDKLILGQAKLVLKDLESHGIKIVNSYTEDGELIVYVDESIYKDGK